MSSFFPLLIDSVALDFQFYPFLPLFSLTLDFHLRTQDIVGAKESQRRYFA